MATEDGNNKNTSGKNLDTNTGKEELKSKDELSNNAADKPTAPGNEEIETTSAAGGKGDPEPDNIKKQATAEELEEESIDEEETEFLLKDCMCMEQDGDYYCFKLKQGRWIQWSVVPYPTKKMCEAACCNT